MTAKGNTDKVSVETGVEGLYIELTIPEGIEYIEKRKQLLQEKVGRFSNQAHKIQSHIEAFTKSLEALGSVPY